MIRKSERENRRASKKEGRKQKTEGREDKREREGRERGKRPRGREKPREGRRRGKRREWKTGERGKAAEEGNRQERKAGGGSCKSRQRQDVRRDGVRGGRVAVETARILSAVSGTGRRLPAIPPLPFSGFSTCATAEGGFASGSEERGSKSQNPEESPDGRGGKTTGKSSKAEGKKRGRGREFRMGRLGKGESTSVFSSAFAAPLAVHLPGLRLPISSAMCCGRLAAADDSLWPAAADDDR